MAQLAFSNNLVIFIAFFFMNTIAFRETNLLAKLDATLNKSDTRTRSALGSCVLETLRLLFPAGAASLAQGTPTTL